MAEVGKTPNFLEANPNQQANVNGTFVTTELLSKCAARPAACQILSMDQQQEQQHQQHQPPPQWQQLSPRQKLLEAQRRFLSQRQQQQHQQQQQQQQQKQKQYPCQRKSIADIIRGIANTNSKNSKNSNKSNNNFTPSAIPCDSVLLLNIKVASDYMAGLSRGLGKLGITTVRLAEHIWKRINDPLRVLVLEAMWTKGCTTGQPISAAAARAGTAQMAAMLQLYSVASLWVATKLEEIWWEVPSGQIMAKAGRTTPALLLEAEVRVLQWCEWAPYNGFVRDDAHLPTDS
ncbi:hypothetical protein Vafri_20963 [Volvox africanus]|uniref:Uncharacterized protein n=1 Tax=Volvox africanus TaxID=51714 RepID=A0A8J4FA35_9CHLO|nr:hypothetical protein Vafri_20963 [Volvox africanus]